ncbi:hypothetical protein Cgig2_015136 [Carnegiea gigantea]|uniref:Uncharacterized protein n=1 Tax=Carnegiea gigantea TaxID=171969 RepID=A0A9Q1KQN1_9CARY|nr:hypothetical protein Cgig2_015136 [Carnegiea gigantea]
MLNCSFWLSHYSQSLFLSSRRSPVARSVHRLLVCSSVFPGGGWRPGDHLRRPFFVLRRLQRLPPGPMGRSVIPPPSSGGCGPRRQASEGAPAHYEKEPAGSTFSELSISRRHLLSANWPLGVPHMGLQEARYRIPGGETGPNRFWDQVQNFWTRFNWDRN